MNSLRLLGALAAVGLVAALGGCSQERTPEAFCTTLTEHKERYLSAGDMAVNAMQGGDLLGGVAQMASAYADLQVMWDDLAKVAPEEIQPDVESVRDANAQHLESLRSSTTNPLNAVASSLASALFNSSQFERVDAYIRQHCDDSSSLAAVEAPLPTVAPSNDSQSSDDAPSHPPNDTAEDGAEFTDGDELSFGSVVFRDGDGGARTRIDSLQDHGFLTTSSLSPASDLLVTTFDTAGDAQSTRSFSPTTGYLTSCGITPVSVSGDAGYAVLRVDSVPPAGLTPAQYSIFVELYNRDQSFAAEHPVRVDSDGSASCASTHSATDTGIMVLGATASGDHLAVTIDDSESREALFVDLTNGDLTAVPSEPIASWNLVANSLISLCSDVDGYCATTPGLTDRPWVGSSHANSFAWWTCPGIECAYDQRDGTVVAQVAASDAVQKINVHDASVVWSFATAGHPNSSVGAKTDLETKATIFRSPMTTDVVALDSSGVELWSVTADEVCSAARGTVVVRGNGHLALLDGRTGEQLDYIPDGHSCPTYLGGGLSWRGGVFAEPLEVLLMHPAHADMHHSGDEAPSSGQDGSRVEAGSGAEASSDKLPSGWAPSDGADVCQVMRHLWGPTLGLDSWTSSSSSDADATYCNIYADSDRFDEVGVWVFHGTPDYHMAQSASELAEQNAHTLDEHPTTASEVFDEGPFFGRSWTPPWGHYTEVYLYTDEHVFRLHSSADATRRLSLTESRQMMLDFMNAGPP